MLENAFVGHTSNFLLWVMLPEFLLLHLEVVWTHQS
jgi:hypothetical protein